MTALIGLDQRLRAAKLQVITDLRGGSGFGEYCRSLYSAGVDIIQVRDQTITGEAKQAALAEASREAFNASALLVVGRDLDAAATFGADVAHLGASDGDVAQARTRLHEYALVGRSAHAEQDLLGSGADYLLVGPTFGDRVPGLGLVSKAAEVLPVTEPASIPWFAVGGITLDNAAEVIAAGAVRLAVASAVTTAADPAAAAAALAEVVLKRWQNGDMFGYVTASFGSPKATLNPGPTSDPQS